MAPEIKVFGTMCEVRSPLKFRVPMVRKKKNAMKDSGLGSPGPNMTEKAKDSVKKKSSGEKPKIVSPDSIKDPDKLTPIEILQMTDIADNAAILPTSEETNEDQRQAPLAKSS